MKWPSEVRFFRHAESEYNILKQKKAADPEYRRFQKLFNKNPLDPRTHALAVLMQEKYALGFSDRETPITPEGEEQSIQTGKNLPRDWPLPDVIFVSGYKRTQQTLDGVIKGYPELAKVRVVEDERIREQDHGLSLLYSDWRIFHTLHPEQGLLSKHLKSYDYRYPNGENIPDVRDRVRSFNSMLIREYVGERVWVFTHHLTILSFRANLENWDHEKFQEIDKKAKPLNCGVTSYIGRPELGKNGKLMLNTYNKVCA